MLPLDYNFFFLDGNKERVETKNKERVENINKGKWKQRMNIRSFWFSNQTFCVR
jgi:hypothetical protein